MEATEAERLREQLVAVPVLRAGLGLLDAVTDLYPGTVVGYLGMERDEVTLQPRDYYAKLPPMQGRRALVLDPMLATGGSGAAAVTHVKANAAPKSIGFVCVVAAPEGIARMAAEHPDVPIVAGALDRQLNDVGFILPGARRLRRSPARHRLGPASRPRLRRRVPRPPAVGPSRRSPRGRRS